MITNLLVYGTIFINTEGNFFRACKTSCIEKTEPCITNAGQMYTWTDFSAEEFEFRGLQEFQTESLTTFELTIKQKDIRSGKWIFTLALDKDRAGRGHEFVVTSCSGENPNCIRMDFMKRGHLNHENIMVRYLETKELMDMSVILVRHGSMTTLYESLSGIKIGFEVPWSRKPNLAWESVPVVLNTVVYERNSFSLPTDIKEDNKWRNNLTQTIEASSDFYNVWSFTDVFLQLLRVYLIFKHVIRRHYTNFRTWTTKCRQNPTIIGALKVCRVWMAG